MSILSNPRTLYFTRILQLLFGIGFLVLVSDAGVHRGWWDNINGALAVGGTFLGSTTCTEVPQSYKDIYTKLAVAVIATILTFALTIHALVTHHLKSNPFSGGSLTRTTLRLVAEAIVFLLWIATATLMLRPKGGCAERGIGEGLDDCVDKGNKNFHHYSDQPLARWDIGIAFDFVEM